MNQLEILQDQFNAAAKEFPGMMHTISQQSKEGFDPILSSGNIWDSPDCLYVWMADKPREPEEQGYPTSHWLERSILQKWNVLAAYDVFCSVADEAGKLLIDIAPKMPELKGLWVEGEAEYWVLALHRLNPRPEWTTIIPGGKTLLTGNEPESREAQPGESFISIMDNVFLQSALACAELLKRTKETPAKTDSGGGKNKEVVYIEINLATHIVTVGTRQHPITSDKVWMFIKILVEDKQQHKATPREDGRINWKNARDMLRRKIGKTATGQMIICSGGCYALDPNVVIKGTGQIGIHRTKSNQSKPVIN